MVELTGDLTRPEPERLQGVEMRTGHLGPQLGKQTEKHKKVQVNEMYTGHLNQKPRIHGFAILGNLFISCLAKI